MREEKEKDGEGRLFQRMLFMPKVTHRTGGIRRTKKQSVHYRILRSYKDTLHGPSVIIGFQKTQIYQRFAGSRQEVFILKIQNDENNAAQQDNGRRFHIEIKQKQGQYFLLFLFDSIELLLHHSLQKHPQLLLQRYSDRSV